MTGEALGLIEAIGLPAAIAAADTAAKAANVRLLGYELSKGGGLVTVKLTGDVAAVKAAIEAGGAEAKRVYGLWAVHIIPRPAAGTASMVLAESRVSPQVNTEEPQTQKAEQSKQMQVQESQAQPIEQVQVPEPEQVQPAAVVREAPAEQTEPMKAQKTEPAPPVKKNESRSTKRKGKPDNRKEHE